MSSPIVNLPILGTQAGFRRFTVPEYHKLIDIGVLTEDDNLELLEGYLIHKMSRNPPHDRVLQRLNRRLMQLLPEGWDIRIQSAITLGDSEPEPDVVLVRGDDAMYENHHPGPSDIGLVIEVSDSSLTGDRIDKARIYARAGLPVYWIINLVDQQIEVMTQPSGPGATPDFGQKEIRKKGQIVTVRLDGVDVVTFKVEELLP